MRHLLLLSVLAAFAAGPSFAGEDDSALKKAAKIRVVEEIDDDSAAKKAAKLKATEEIVSDEDSSAARKGAKLKLGKEIAE